MTREQIESFRDRVQWAPEAVETVNELCALALAHLDSARARRVGEAVIAAGETGAWMVDEAIDSMRNGVGFDADDMPKLLAIRDAMRGEP